MKRPAALYCFSRTPSRNAYHKLLLDRTGQPYALLDRHMDPDEQQDLSTGPAHHATLTELRLRAQGFLLESQLHAPRELKAREEDLVAAFPIC